MYEINNNNDKQIKYNLIESKKIKEREYSLLKIRLFTGRTHQIRVQFSSRRTPLCGDVKYGSKDRNSDIALFSHSITFSHPTTNEVLTFTEIPNKINYPLSLFGSDLSE